MMPTKGTKQEKVRAAFEYADFFIEECTRDTAFDLGELNLEEDNLEHKKEDENASENRTGLSRIFSGSKRKV